MLPFASRNQIVELDVLLVERFKISLSELMDTAGLRLAEFVQQQFPRAHNSIVFCGKGHNGGDGLAAARYLQEFGFKPTVVILPGELKSLTNQQLESLDAVNIPIVSLEDYSEHVMMARFDVAVDCILGHGLNGPPRGDAEQAILAINEAHEHNIPIIACDVPSGMDCDEGPIYEPHVLATHIVSMALPRKGLRGQAPVWVADIGVPLEAYDLIGLPSQDYFKHGSFVRQ